MSSDPVEATLLVTQLLESLGVLYVIGGSMASTAYGRVRTTMDTDLVADLKSEHVEPFVKALENTFYVDEASLRNAIEQRTHFNLIHLVSMFKIDVFLPKDRPFDRQQLARRINRVIDIEPERTAYVASPEDIILAKLEWYKLGGETSEQQWQDVQSIFQIQGARLNKDYLARFAAELNVSSLLEKAIEEA